MSLLLVLLDRCQAMIRRSNSRIWAYNIQKTGEDVYRLTVAVAGFKPTELSVVAEGMTLTVAGAKPLNESEGYLYRGIADQSFKRTFQLAECMKVMSAKLKNGLLWIELRVRLRMRFGD